MTSIVKSDGVDPQNILAFLIETLRVYAKVETVDWSAETPIEAVGIDSFDFVEILFKIEDKYGVDIDYNANLKFTELKTVGDLASEIFKIVDRKLAA